MEHDGSVVIAIEADDTGLAEKMESIRETVSRVLAQLTDQAAGTGRSLYDITDAAFLASALAVDAIAGTLGGEDALSRVAAAAAALAGRFIASGESLLPRIVQSGALAVSAFTGGAESRLPQVTAAASALIAAMAGGLDSGRGSLTSVASSLASAVSGSFLSLGWSETGAALVAGIASGVAAAAGSLASAAVSAARGAIGAAKRFLGIASPSKLARDEIGVQIPRGIALGVEEESRALAPSVAAGMAGLMDRVRAAVAGRMVDTAAPAVPVVRLPERSASRERPQPVPAQLVTVEFTGSLSQLGRVLQPVISAETKRLGGDLIET